MDEQKDNSISKEIALAKKQGANMLSPTIELHGLNEFHKPVVDSVYLSADPEDGDVYPEKSTGETKFRITAHPDVCPECAVKHEPHEPHNKDSLFYQVKFFMEHNRHPTWADALSHCADGLKAEWIKELKKRGIKI